MDISVRTQSERKTQSIGSQQIKYSNLMDELAKKYDILGIEHDSLRRHFDKQNSLSRNDIF
jgi:hypothetical protein